MTNVGSELSHFNLTSKVDGFSEWILNKDIVYIGGGNTSVFMLEIWKKNNLEPSSLKMLMKKVLYYQVLVLVLFVGLTGYCQTQWPWI